MAHNAPSNSLIFLLVLVIIQAARGATSRPSPAPAGYVPVRAVVYRSVALPAATVAAAGDEAPGGGGRYEPFQLCMGCRCCAAAAGSSSSASSSSSCVDTRCCYAIDCNVPGKPFGVCAFSPRTCGCGAGSNCTTT
ncbi:hypothetical protein D1007_05920 [Hordeum vulgare]|uniref:Predicted protein n=1 Tax=Hordeum vulgare subsp. vulgare TaxID=112509 RepID=F2DUZ2_HORVV|nr:uncharacterized protein LOC123448114 [Hordeum vulgare subsp. vulgare]KAE8816582.1 hypothetical protein D1007_05920 [Hordeum vulgare]KAI4997141.1 hypothetical protein ZWY2020_052483 [Hordeum vulgare]BAJ98913.1 predicted protein [Hordeum vulgare subsp. vulgare]